MNRAALMAALLLSAPAAASAQQTQTAVFAGGCFWGIEAVFEHVKGVSEVVSGYAGGTLKHPSYEVVSAGIGGHAESVRVTYDPTQVSYAQLIEVFMNAHDPTELNRQGPDVGTQYRSAIFWSTGAQEQVARKVMDRLRDTDAFRGKIVTELTRAGEFWPAEDYHQDYLIHHLDQPYIVYNDLPKLVDLKRRFPTLYR
ncbi:MAG: peptide-methionine (S)-S-oxide reductase [Gemmatimonadetes bacterium]|nr:peptide-methionine (S)-S-oxide reductase [Gemmatimonadota bacterium]